MMPFSVGSLEPTYQAFKSYYVAKYGSNKFEKLYDSVANSDRIRNLFRITVTERIAPSGTDFISMILELRYFIIAKNETRAMGAVVALRFWNEQVNHVHHFATPEQIDQKLQVIFNKWGL